MTETTTTITPAMCVAASDAAMERGVILPASHAGDIIEAALRAAPSPAPAAPSAAQPVAWMCEDLILPNDNPLFTQVRENAERRAEVMHESKPAWRVTPLYAAQPAQGGSVTEAAKRIAWEMRRRFLYGCLDDLESLWRSLNPLDRDACLSAARASAPAAPEVVDRLSALGLCWDAEHFPTLDPDEEFSIAPENHYRVTITTSLEDTATGWGATFSEAVDAALRSAGEEANG